MLRRAKANSKPVIGKRPIASKNVYTMSTRIADMDKNDQQELLRSTSVPNSEYNNTLESFKQRNTTLGDLQSVYYKHPNLRSFVERMTRTGSYAQAETRSDSGKTASEGIGSLSTIDKVDVVPDKSIYDLGVRQVTVQSTDLSVITQYSTEEPNGRRRFWKNEQAARKYGENKDGKVKIYVHKKSVDENKDEHEMTDKVLGFFDDVTVRGKTERVLFLYNDSSARLRAVESYAKKGKKKVRQ